MSTHQKILDSVFFGESFGSESRTLLRRVFDVNQLEKSVESKEVDLVNSLPESLRFYLTGTLYL